MAMLKKIKRSNVQRQSAPKVLFAAFVSVLTAAAHAQVEPITVQGKAAPVLEPEQASVSGFADVPVRGLAQSVIVFSKDALTETAITTLSQLTRLDAGLADAYNTAGYNQSLMVRGLLLDNGNSFRRDGLPVLNIGPLALENTSSIEVLKGVSGFLAGVSAPGGLVNVNTRRATQSFQAQAQLHAGERGSAGVSAGLSAGLSAEVAPKVRMQLDAAAQRLRPEIEGAAGSRTFASAMLDATFGATKISADVEWQRFAQRSVPGFSPQDTDGDGAGDALPAASTFRNLNTQPWTQPFQTQGTLAAAKLMHRVSDAWTFTLAGQSQRVRTDDRIAFPDGCGSAGTFVYPGFCGNGDFDLYDFRSDNERRRLNVLDAQLAGTVLNTRVGLGLQKRHFTQRTQAQAYNYAGTGNVFAPALAAFDAAPDLTVAGTNLDERATEAFVSAHRLFGIVRVFGGARVSRVEKSSVRTDGTEATQIGQTIATPWFGASAALAPMLNIYASWGQGAESETVPNRPAQYVNFGAALATLKSTQIEIGVKWQAAPRLLFTAAAFEIVKPFADDLFEPDGSARKVAGEKEARHRGVELALVGTLAPKVSTQASLTFLDATFTRAVNPATVGQRVTNVPRLAATWLIDVQSAHIAGLAMNALVSAHSRKNVTAHGGLTIPGGAQLDLGVRYVRGGAGQTVTWRANLENATNRVAWREAPTQPWGGIYAFPTPQRTLRASITVNW